jgi:hypothetical protein
MAVPFPKIIIPGTPNCHSVSTLTVCPDCGSEIKNPADGCSNCGKDQPPGKEKRRAQADLLLKIGAIIFIFGIFLPILFVTGGVIFGAGAVIYLMNRR